MSLLSCLHEKLLHLPDLEPFWMNNHRSAPSTPLSSILPTQGKATPHPKGYRQEMGEQHHHCTQVETASPESPAFDKH